MANSCMPSSSATLACVLLFTKELLNSCKRKKFHSVVTIINKLQAGEKMLLLSLRFLTSLSLLTFWFRTSQVIYIETHSVTLSTGDFSFYSNSSHQSLLILWTHYFCIYVMHIKCLFVSFLAIMYHLFTSPVLSQIICSFLVQVIHSCIHFSHIKCK